MASELLPVMELPILPLRTMVLFPHAALPMTLNRANASQAVAAAGEDGLIAVVTQAHPEAEVPCGSDLYAIGTGAVVRQLTQPGSDQTMVILEGLERIAIIDIVQTYPYLRARVRRLASERPLVDSVYIAARSNLLDAFQEMVQLSSVLPDELGVVARTIADDSALTDMIGSALVETAPATRQDILATLNVRRRMDKLNEMIAREVEALKIREKLRVEVQSKIADTQKEIVLREQLKAIRKELGETGGEENQIAELRTKIESGDLPAEVLEEARRELDRLEDMPAGSPEYSMVRNYCEWVAELPWNRCTATPIDLGHAKGLAARRCALRTIIIPMENEPNLREEVPDHLRGEVEVKLAASIEQAVDLALAPQQGGSLMAHQKIQDVMTKEVFGVGEDASIREVARLMRDQKIGDVLVTDPQGKLCGIITDHDIVVRAVADEGNDLDQLRAKDICTADRIVTLEPSAGVENAIRLMTEKAIRRIPVVENNQPVGIVTIGDLAAQRDPNSALGQISQAAPNN